MDNISIEKSEWWPLFFCILIEDTLIHNNHDCIMIFIVIVTDSTTLILYTELWQLLTGIILHKHKKYEHSVSCGTGSFQWWYRGDMQKSLLLQWPFDVESISQ